MIKAVWVLVLWGVTGFACAAPAAGGPEVGQVSPNIIGRTMDDESWRLKNDLGKPKVINFFWVGCIPCKKEMPELSALEKKYPAFKFIAVHSQAEPVEVVTKFVKSLPAAPSNIILTSGGVQETFRYAGLPHTIVLDENNIVKLNISGYTPQNMKRLEQALQEFR